MYYGVGGGGALSPYNHSNPIRCICISDCYYVHSICIFILLCEHLTMHMPLVMESTYVMCFRLQSIEPALLSPDHACVFSEGPASSTHRVSV